MASGGSRPIGSLPLNISTITDVSASSAASAGDTATKANRQMFPNPRSRRKTWRPRGPGRLDLGSLSFTQKGPQVRALTFTHGHVLSPL